ncbi:MAG: hypothetical protein JWP51_5478 [Bradyrhizobium sp.]|jgi:hypothetical protein|nr:hypothetical protein [Bradyrhizobium sp.]
MTEVTSGADEAKWRRWRSVADLYHAYFTGLILTVVTRRGTADAAEFMFRVFRRQQKAYRNYAMEYVRTAAPVMVQLFGPEDAGYLLHLAGKLIGMQYFDEVARAFGLGRGTAKEFDEFLRALFEAQDDAAEIGDDDSVFEIRQVTWKLMADVADYHPACAKVLEGLFEGLGAGCGRNIPVTMRPAAGGKPPFVWSIG